LCSRYSKPYDKSFTCGDNYSFKLTQTDTESLTLLARQLAADYHSVVETGNEIDLINFEIRCTDIARRLLDIVNNFVRFNFRLTLEEKRVVQFDIY
jgi:hypothetical protein